MAQGTTKGVPIDIDPLLANNSDLLVPSQKAVKTYTDNGLSNKVSKAGDTMSGSLILNGDPTVAYQAATKSYVDTLINGIDWKQSVNAATVATLPTYAVTGSGQILTRTTNGAIPSATTDNITLTVNQRVLVKNETSTLTPNNGIYIVTQVGSGSLPFILTRASDANTPALLAEATVSVGAGLTLSNTQWHCNPAAVPAIIGTTYITFAQIGTGTYTFNSPLVNNSGVISIPLSTASVSGYLSSTDWTNFNTAYTNRITSLTNSGSGAATLVSNVLNIPIPPSPVIPTLDQVLTQGNTSHLNASVETIGVWSSPDGAYATIVGIDGGVQVNGGNGSNLFGLQDNYFYFGYTGYIGSISTGSLTQSRSYILPDANGTIALNSSYGTNNISANNFFGGFISIAASGVQVELDVNSPQSYLITGSGGQTIKMPGATTLPKGATYYISNKQSAGTITVNDNSNTLIKSIQPGGYLIVTLLDNTTTAGSWDPHFQAPSNVTWGNGSLDYAGSITSATWDGNVIPITKGGTGSAIQNFVDLVTNQTIGGSKTFSTAPKLSSLTASQLLALDSSKGIQTLDVATYPSLAELAYVKGVTSSIQTQLGGKLTSTLTSANIFVGNGSNVATGVALSGDATISNTGSLTIANNAVTLAKMQTIPVNTILGNVSAGPIVPVTLSGTQVTTILDVFTSTLKGLVPSGSGGSTTNFLRADGTWAVPAGGGGSTPSSYNYIISTNFS
jgi:hypothetical protein